MASHGGQMRKNILVIGPALTRSGYGEQTRFALRSLRSREDLFDVFIIPTNWGNTGWLADSTEEREWIDHRIKATQERNMQKLPYDATLQVDVPWAKIQGSEGDAGFRRITPHDIGFTAGIETTKVSPEWLQSVNEMTRLVVVSSHSKQVFENTKYEGHDETGNSMVLKNTTPIEVVGFPAKKTEAEDLELELEHDFNFLTIAQWGPRKNLENTINWFIEEFRDEPVGLVIKTNLMKNCLMDRNRVFAQLKSIVQNYGETTCKVYLLHGDMTEEEVAGLYKHPKIKSYVSFSHGEGFGLPIFDAVCNGMPVVTTAWSGQCDFLAAPRDKKKNSKMRMYFAKVDFNMAPIQQEAVWNGILQADSMWAYPRPGSAKRKMREVYQKYSKHQSMASRLKRHILKEFDEETMYQKFIDALGFDFTAEETTPQTTEEVFLL